MVVKNSSHLRFVVEGGVDYLDRHVPLVEVITESESPHGDIRKISTVAVYDEKPGFHVN